MHFLLVSKLVSIYTVRSRKPNDTSSLSNTHTHTHRHTHTQTQSCQIFPDPSLGLQFPTSSYNSHHGHSRRGTSLFSLFSNVTAPVHTASPGRRKDKVTLVSPLIAFIYKVKVQLQHEVLSRQSHPSFLVRTGTTSCLCIST